MADLAVVVPSSACDRRSDTPMGDREMFAAPYARHSFQDLAEARRALRPEQGQAHRELGTEEGYPSRQASPGALGATRVAAPLPTPRSSRSWWTADRSTTTPRADHSVRSVLCPSNMPRSSRVESLPKPFLAASRDGNGVDRQSHHGAIACGGDARRFCEIGEGWHPAPRSGSDARLLANRPAASSHGDKSRRRTAASSAVTSVVRRAASSSPSPKAPKARVERFKRVDPPCRRATRRRP